MWLKLNLNGIILQLRIKGYVAEKKDNCWWKWCKTDFSFSSGKWLNYAQQNAEVLLTSEIKDLKNRLEELLNNEIEKELEIPCVEPDFTFILIPKNEVENLSMKWTVTFWNGGLTRNELVVTLYENEIRFLLQYLKLICGTISKDSPEVADMIDKGVLYGQI